jgi:prepilin-type N-terminal cleavage/methylation domain-containing protein
MHTKARSAFTLVELLVVIAIIGLLSTIAVSSLSSAKRLSRNAKRIADVKQLVTAFNLGLDANGSYPTTGGDFWKCISSACTGGWAVYPTNGTVDAFFTPFITKLTDPDDKNLRGYGGYMYNGAEVAAGGLPVISYLLEPPATCSIGRVASSGANYIQCTVSLY